MGKMLCILCVSLVLLAGCTSNQSVSSHQNNDSVQWVLFQQSYLPSCIGKVKKLGYNDEQSANYCNCQLEYIKAHYTYTDVVKDSFFYRHDVIDSLVNWLDSCFVVKVDYTEQWGDLPKDQVKEVCMASLRKKNYPEKEASRICDCYTSKVIANIEPGHITDMTTDSFSVWISFCAANNN